MPGKRTESARWLRGAAFRLVQGWKGKAGMNEELTLAGSAWLAGIGFGLAAADACRLLFSGWSLPISALLWIVFAAGAGAALTFIQAAAGFSPAFRAAEAAFLCAVGAAAGSAAGIDLHTAFGGSLSPETIDRAGRAAIAFLSAFPSFIAWMGSTYLSVVCPPLMHPQKPGAGGLAAARPPSASPQARAGRLTALMIGIYVAAAALSKHTSHPPGWLSSGLIYAAGLLAYLGFSHHLSRRAAWAGAEIRALPGLFSIWSRAAAYWTASAVLLAALAALYSSNRASPLAHIPWTELTNRLFAGFLAFMHAGMGGGRMKENRMETGAPIGASGPDAEASFGADLVNLLMPAFFAAAAAFLAIWAAVAVGRRLQMGRLWVWIRTAVLQPLAALGRWIIRRLAGRGAGPLKRPKLGFDLLAQAVRRRLQWMARTAAPSEPHLRIRHLFRLLMRWSGRRGLPRRPWQTAGEYALSLAEKAPEAREEIGNLTRAYALARYRPGLADRELAALSSLWWRRLLRRTRIRSTRE